VSVVEHGLFPQLVERVAEAVKRFPSRTRTAQSGRYWVRDDPPQADVARGLIRLADHGQIPVATRDRFGARRRADQHSSAASGSTRSTPAAEQVTGAAAFDHTAGRMVGWLISELRRWRELRTSSTTTTARAWGHTPLRSSFWRSCTTSSTARRALGSLARRLLRGFRRDRDVLRSSTRPGGALRHPTVRCDNAAGDRSRKGLRRGATGSSNSSAERVGGTGSIALARSACSPPRPDGGGGFDRRFWQCRGAVWSFPYRKRPRPGKRLLIGVARQDGAPRARVRGVDPVARRSERQ